MSAITSAAAGSASGFIATVPMTLAMTAMHRQLPAHEQQPLPPRQITEELVERAGAAENLQEGEMRALAYVNHFGYGAGSGAAFGVLASRMPLPPVMTGVAFALSVWTLSYLGWLPATRILPPATEQPARRNALMIAAHIVWGASMGLAFDRLQRRP